MKRFPRLLATIAVIIWSCGFGTAFGEDAGAAAITDTDEIRAVFSDQTMLGYFVDEFGAQDRWTEYHCPNGQSRYIHGTNFLRGVWQVGDGRICYTYDRPNPGETFCFQLFHDGAAAYKLINVDHPEDGYSVFISARLAGDPFKLRQLEGGACENLSS